MSVGIQLLSSSARVTSVKSTQGVEQPKIEAGGSRQYVDPVVYDVAPDPEGIRRRKRAAENCGAEAEIDDDEVDAEIADLQRHWRHLGADLHRPDGPRH